MDQENLKRFFVGEKFDKLYYKNFSFWALLFGPFYYFYRKLVGKGFLFLLLEIIISVCILELDKLLLYCLILHIGNTCQRKLIKLLINLKMSK